MVWIIAASRCVGVRAEGCSTYVLPPFRRGSGVKAQPLPSLNILISALPGGVRLHIHLSHCPIIIWWGMKIPFFANTVERVGNFESGVCN